MSFRGFLLFLTCVLVALSGCKSSSDSTANLKQNQQTVEQEALSQAFAARGFYRSALGNINYLNSRQCSNYQLQSHRGSIKYPENSVAAVIDSLDNDFDVVEVDVRVTSDDVWVIHHDKYTGRESGTIDNKRRKIESLNYQREWGYLRTRDQHSGKLLDSMPANFRQLASTFSKHATEQQRLNIEIKSNASTGDLEMLDYLAFKIIGAGRYFYSSLSLTNLERMRDINSNVFLSFIQRPAKRSVRLLQAKLEQGASGDNIYKRNKSRIDSLTGYASKRYREKRYDNQRAMQRLKKSLIHNYGWAVDIRQFAASPSSFKKWASIYQLPLATYSINGQAFHAKALFNLPVSQRPNSVIIDDTVYGFCSQYSLPKMKPYTGTTHFTRRLAELPHDLDLERLTEVNTYYGNGLYPALGGLLKSIHGSLSDHDYTPLLLDPKAGEKQPETAVELKTQQAIKVELRKGK